MRPGATPGASGGRLAFSLRVLTWNIHAGIGADRRYDMARVIALLRRQAPDIAALQEIEARGRADAPFAALREALGGHAVEAPTIVQPGGRYGHMLASRWPIRDAALHDISVPGREPRAIIAATVATPAGDLRVLCTHFGLRPGERRRQAARLAALAREEAGPVLAMGDFNEWAWRGPVHRALSPALPARTRLRSFPVRLPLFPLDRIHCRPAAMLGPSWTDGAARLASDHLPVIAELRLSGTAQPHF